MSFHLILSFAILAIILSYANINFLSSLYYLFLALKIVKLSLDYRLKQMDNVIFICVFLFSGGCLISKDFFLHYIFIGSFAHSEIELLQKIYVYCIASFLSLIPSYKPIEYLYRNDIIRTFIAIGYAMSDAGALNWITREYYNNHLTEFQFWMIMTFLILVPGFFFILKEVLSYDKIKIISVLKEVRNILFINSALGIFNIILKLQTILPLDDRKIIGFMLNICGMILYFSYKSYLFGRLYENKLKFIKKNE